MEKGSIVLLHRRDSLGTPFTQESAFVVGEVPDGINLIAFNRKEAAHLSGPDWPLAFERLSGIRHLGHPDVLAGRVHSFYSEIEDGLTPLGNEVGEFLDSRKPVAVHDADGKRLGEYRFVPEDSGAVDPTQGGTETLAEPTPTAQPSSEAPSQTDGPQAAPVSPTPTGSESSEPSGSTAASGQSAAPGETVQPPAETATS